MKKYHMSDIIILFIILCVTGVVVIIISAVIYQQAPSAKNFSVKKLMNEFNRELRKIERKWSKNKFGAIVRFIGLLATFFFKIRRANPFAFIAISIMGIIGSVLVALASITFWDVLMEFFKWLKAKELANLILRRCHKVAVPDTI